MRMRTSDREPGSPGHHVCRQVALLATAMALFLPGVAAADTLSLQVNGPGADSAWTYAGGSADFTNVQTQDGDTSYVFVTSSNKNHTWTVDDSSGQSGAINSVTVHAFLNGNERVKLGVNTTFMPTGVTVTGSYVEYTNPWATNPAGGAWTWANVDALEIGLRSQNSGGWSGDVRATHIWVVVDYTPAAGSDTLAASANAPIETIDPSQGQAGIVMQRFRVDSDSAGNGQIELASLTLQDQGSAGTGDIDTVRVYIDTDTTFAGSTQIGSVAFTTDPITVTLNLATAGDRTVTNGTPKYVFVVYDLNAGATIGATIRSWPGPTTASPVSPSTRTSSRSRDRSRTTWPRPPTRRSRRSIRPRARAGS